MALLNNKMNLVQTKGFRSQEVILILHLLCYHPQYNDSIYVHAYAGIPLSPF